MQYQKAIEAATALWKDGVLLVTSFLFDIRSSHSRWSHSQISSIANMHLYSLLIPTTTGSDNAPWDNFTNLAVLNPLSTDIQKEALICIHEPQARTCCLMIHVMPCEHIQTHRFYDEHYYLRNCTVLHSQDGQKMQDRMIFALREPCLWKTPYFLLRERNKALNPILSLFGTTVSLRQPRHRLARFWPSIAFRITHCMVEVFMK